MTEVSSSINAIITTPDLLHINQMRRQLIAIVRAEVDSYIRQLEQASPRTIAELAEAYHLEVRS